MALEAEKGRFRVRKRFSWLYDDLDVCKTARWLESSWVIERVTKDPPVWHPFAWADEMMKCDTDDCPEKGKFVPDPEPAIHYDVWVCAGCKGIRAIVWRRLN